MSGRYKIGLFLQKEHTLSIMYLYTTKKKILILGQGASTSTSGERKCGEKIKEWVIVFCLGMSAIFSINSQF
jgi:hypothetical protein